MVMPRIEYNACHHCGKPVATGCVISLNPTCYRCKEEGHEDGHCKKCREELDRHFNFLKKKLGMKKKEEPKVFFLEPCPFCGEKGDLIDMEGGYVVRCSRYLCIASSICFYYPTKEEAQKNWNNREIEYNEKHDYD